MEKLCEGKNEQEQTILSDTAIADIESLYEYVDGFWFKSGLNDFRKDRDNVVLSGCYHDLRPKVNNACYELARPVLNQDKAKFDAVVSRLLNPAEGVWDEKAEKELSEMFGNRLHGNFVAQAIKLLSSVHKLVRYRMNPEKDENKAYLNLNSAWDACGAIDSIAPMIIQENVRAASVKNSKVFVEEGGKEGEVADGSLEPALSRT